MKEDAIKIEERLKNMKEIYIRLSELLDSLPEIIPDKSKKLIKDLVLGDQELKNLMECIDVHRPPRIFVIGRTGVGKSSLINAICGSYVAKVSDVKSCTEHTQIYECRDHDRILMEILDTRGIAESESLNSTISAEEMLIKEVGEFSPDIAIFMLNCTHRDDVKSDVEFLKKIAESYFKVNKSRLPIVVAINKCDEMAPTRYKEPQRYPESKINKIEEVIRYYKSIIIKNGLKVDDIIAVSSLIDWKTQDGLEVSVEDIESLPEADIEHLQMGFDGRYKIDALLDALEKAIPDVEAQMGLRMAARLNDVVHRIAKHLVKIFAGISATVALTPIPVSDMYVLITLQCILVALIASLSGRTISMESAKEFIVGAGGVTGSGFLFRLAAQQGSKLINLIFPGAGSTISAVVASWGTTAIGNAATSYYIDNMSMKDVRAKFKKEQKEHMEE